MLTLRRPRACAYINTNTRPCWQAHSCARVQPCAHIHTSFTPTFICTHARLHPGRLAFTFACMHPHMRAFSQTRTHEFTHTCSHVHTDICAYTQNRMYTHTRICIHNAGALPTHTRANVLNILNTLTTEIITLMKLNTENNSCLLAMLHSMHSF